MARCNDVGVTATTAPPAPPTEAEPDPAGRRRAVRRAVIVGAPLLALLALAACGYRLATQASQARVVAGALEEDGRRLQAQVAASDLRGAGATLTRLRTGAGTARDLTGGPLWTAAGWVPVLGRDPAAAREVGAAVASVLDAARPLEAALPRLDPRAARGASTAPAGAPVDVQALQQVAAALPALSEAVAAADDRLRGIDAGALSPQLAAGVRQVGGGLAAARGPLAAAAPSVSLLPPMLGADGPRSWLVLLQQDAEARGTGGIVGAYALVTADRGRLSLVRAAQRSTLGAPGSIPAGDAVPDDLRALWGRDLTEWAGLNLSPHFPWTGRLVHAGWLAGQGRGPGAPRIDYVAAIDQHTVAALLAGTGPVTVRGARVDSRIAVRFLSRDVYLRHPDHREVDAVTAELVDAVFARVAAGRLDLRALVTAVAAQARERRLLVWSPRPAEQERIERTAVGGVLPDTPGPFAMAVVNNGGGNKLDAYLSVRTRYSPGECQQDVRLGAIEVRLTNSAPARGLPAYVVERNDLAERGRTNRVPGATKVLLDVYGPVASTSPLATVDGVRVPAVTGRDRGHTVWRVAVQIPPGATRTVRVLVLQPLALGNRDAAPQVVVQPMAVPATAVVDPPPPCPAGGAAG